MGGIDRMLLLFSFFVCLPPLLLSALGHSLLLSPLSNFSLSLFAYVILSLVSILPLKISGAQGRHPSEVAIAAQIKDRMRDTLVVKHLAVLWFETISRYASSRPLLCRSALLSLQKVRRKGEK